MAKRVTLTKGDSTVRVVAGDVERFKDMGYSEKKPAASNVRKSRSSRDKLGE